MGNWNRVYYSHPYMLHIFFISMPRHQVYNWWVCTSYDAQRYELVIAFMMYIMNETSWSQSKGVQGHQTPLSHQTSNSYMSIDNYLSNIWCLLCMPDGKKSLLKIKFEYSTFCLIVLDIHISWKLIFK